MDNFFGKSSENKKPPEAQNFADQKKKEVIRELKEAEVYAEYTFQPKINKISKTIA